MRSLKHILIKDFIQTISLYFTGILFLINLGFVIFNYQYSDHINKQNETAFTTIITHMVMDDAEDAAISYMEHYSHIHNTRVLYEVDGTILYQTEEEASNYTAYDIVVDGTVHGTVRIDSSASVNVLLSTTFFWIVNFFIAIIYILSLVLYRKYTMKKVNEILEDIRGIRMQIATKDFTKSNIKLEEFLEISNEIKRLETVFKELNNQRLAQLKTITHDMKTPLTILLHLTEGVEDGVLEMDHEIILKIKQEIEHLNQLMDRVNQKDRLEEETEFDLSNLLKDMVVRFQSIYETKQLNLETDIEDGIVYLSNNESMVRIISNVLSNSYYYSKPNTLVKVSLKKTDKIILKIEDHGVGISEEDLKHILEQNYRGHNSETLNQKGSGLGLYIVSILALDVEGTLTISSKLGIGTTVQLSLPIEKEE